MKKLLYILILFPVLVLGQSPDQNWVKSTTYKKPTTQGAVDVTNPADAVVQVSYFDGLGRPIQQVAHKQSNTGKDIVTHIEYDALGRQIKENLPFVASTAASLDIKQNETLAFYATNNTNLTGNPNFETTGNPYSQKEIEASPLNRVFKQATPGNAWKMGDGKEKKFDYQTNETGEVKFFKATATWDATLQSYTTSISSPQSHYNENELNKSIIKDENWKITQSNLKINTTEEFKNNEGQVVLKRTFNSTEILDTYYVYDQYGNLTYVLPPLTESVATQTILDNLGYQYKYDYRNRLVEKKLPGKQPEYIVYDKLDRPIATGPAYNVNGAVDENDKGWLITEYDVFGRVTQTGWKKMTVTESARKTNQTSINSGSNPFVLSTAEILTKNYYDSYNFTGAPSPLPTLVEGQAVATNVKGMPTGSWTKVLDVSNANASEVSYTFYDVNDRPIRSYTSNYLGGFTQVDSKLDWSGKTIYTKTTHKYNNSATLVTIIDRFEYTPQDKLSVHKQQINSLPEQLIAKNKYDELGQLIGKNVGGTYSSSAIGLQTVDYSYNIRGWLKGINDASNLGSDLFAFKINYNTPESATALFNGNISETFWKTNSDGVLRKYSYSYDNLNRLTNAVFIKPQASVNDVNTFNETVSYDKNGNIKTLKRNTAIPNTGMPNLIDDLTYNYDINNKNLLVKVSDISTSPQGFNDGANLAVEYEYDANGNMKKDYNKNISSITYNHLNLPTKIVVGTNTIEYLYNAVGQKVNKKITESSTVKNTHYLAGGFQYKNTVLEFFPHAEGYVQNTAGVYSYVFNYTDHLGNVRLSYSDTNGNGSIQSNEILEENSYYPFGLKHSGYNTQVNSSSDALKYKYNGKELQTELGINMYDMDMRDYDPAIARWVNQDPVLHYDFSPYNAFDNNPVVFADPSGADAWEDKYGYHFTGAEAQSFSSQLQSQLSSNDANDEEGNKEGNEEEDCCPGMERNLDRMIVTRQAEKKGEDLGQALKDYSTGMRDKEWGEAVLIAAKEVAIYYAGGWAVKAIFRGGRYVYIAYKANQARQGLRAFQHASQYGIQSYSILRQLTAGRGLQVHHLIEQRFASTLGVEASSMQSIALTTTEHQAFTNAWRAQIGYRTDNALIRTTNATREQIYEAARVIYKDYPVILNALGL